MSRVKRGDLKAATAALKADKERARNEKERKERLIRKQEEKEARRDEDLHQRKMLEISRKAQYRSQIQEQMAGEEAKRRAEAYQKERDAEQAMELEAAQRAAEAKAQKADRRMLPSLRLWKKKEPRASRKKKAKEPKTDGAVVLPPSPGKVARRMGKRRAGCSGSASSWHGACKGNGLSSAGLEGREPASPKSTRWTRERSDPLAPMQKLDGDTSL